MSEDLEHDTKRDSNAYRTLTQSLVASKTELTIALVLLAAYFYFRIAGFGLEIPFGAVRIRGVDIVLLLGFLMGTWMAFRPSEWAVGGIESAAGHLALSAYVAGMLTSLASNMPEAVVSGLSAFAGWSLSLQGDPTGQVMLDVSVVSVLIAAGFNMILLGITIIILTRKMGDIDVPAEAISKDSVLMRWTIVALASMFALGVLELVYSAPVFDPLPRFPPMGALVLLLSYVIYAVALTKGKVTKTTEVARPNHSKSTALRLAIIGFIGIFIAGEMLTSSVEILLEEYPSMTIGNPVVLPALLLGAAGAIPEHGIALLAAAKGKMGLAIGNLLGGVLQIVLLVMGGIGIFVPIPLDRYVLFQIVAIAGSLYFLKRTITDDRKLDIFEGAMIVLLQAYVFSLLMFATY